MTRARKRDIRRRQRRKRKLRLLRQRLAQTSDAKTRRQLIAKMRKISPTAPVQDA